MNITKNVKTLKDISISGDMTLTIFISGVVKQSKKTEAVEATETTEAIEASEEDTSYLLVETELVKSEMPNKKTTIYKRHEFPVEYLDLLNKINTTSLSLDIDDVELAKILTTFDLELV